jgi:hypothetical protein
MEVKKGKRVPALVVHTPVPIKDEETPGLLDEMWACLLNDYLDNLSDIEADNSVSSSSDAESISTAVMRSERRRLRKLKKQEQNRNRLKGKTIERLRESAVMLVEEGSRVSDQQLFQHLESSRYEKGVLLDVASKRIDEKARKMSEIRDRYGPVPALTSSHRRHVAIIGEECNMATRLIFEPGEEKPPVLGQNWPMVISKSSSIDAEGLVTRDEWMQFKKTESNGVKSAIDPVGMTAPHTKSRTKTRVDANGVIHLEEEDNFLRTNISNDRNRWHLEPVTSALRSKRSQEKRKSLAGNIGGDRECSLYQKLEPRESKSAIGKDLTLVSSQNDGLTSRKDPLPATRLDVPIDSPEVKGTEHRTKELYVSRIDTRDADDIVWSLEEDKRSELDQIRRKKLDREEALVRIRAIKARIAKLEI